MSKENTTAFGRQEDPTDARLIIRHLIVALDRATAGRWRDAQSNIEYAAGRLNNTFGPANVSLEDLTDGK